MNGIQLILMAPAVVCAAAGGILVACDKISRREQNKREARRVKRRYRNY